MISLLIKSWRTVITELIVGKTENIEKHNDERNDYLQIFHCILNILIPNWLHYYFKNNIWNKELDPKSKVQQNKKKQQKRITPNYADQREAYKSTTFRFNDS